MVALPRQPPDPDLDPRSILRRHGLRPQKAWSQNFLVSQGIMQAIVAAVPAEPGDWVVEIGAGPGTLTKALRAAGFKVAAIERDREFIKVLEAEFAGDEGVRILAADAVRTDYAGLIVEKPFCVVGNLPYHLSTPILFRLLEARESIKAFVLMLQREVAARLCSAVGEKNYGVLAVQIQRLTEVRIMRRVPPGAFFPAPKVESAVVRFDVLSTPCPPVRDERAFSALVRGAFSTRRKMLLNCLARLYPQEMAVAALEELGLDPKRRPQELTIEQFAALSDKLGLPR